MYLKTLTVDTDWLHEIDGLKVSEAIKYLQTLDQSHVLSYTMEGDTHGCSVTSGLSFDVPMTNKEIFAQLEKRYLEEIKLFEDAKQKHLKEGRTSRIEGCENHLARLRGLLEDARIKYCEE